MRSRWGALIFVSIPLADVAADMHQRFARLTLAEGRVEVEQAVTGERLEPERNLPIGQGFWVQTANGRAEIELDEGSQIRLGSGSLAEFSDLARLSTGQRISLVSLEQGTLYATAEPAGLDAFVVVAPGMEITFSSGARIRVHAGEETSNVAVIEGRVRFTSRAAELELRQGQTAQVSPQSIERFQLFREVAMWDLDSWSEQRDKEADTRDGGTKLPQFLFGLGELDGAGKWIEHSELGKLWQPRAPEGWAPFRTGRWRWYEGVGFTWISSEPWGWLTYHYGRWAQLPPSGWVWVPGGPEAGAGDFHPGATYWLRGGAFVGWGPLAPGENWRGDAAPSLYSAANTTFAAYDPAARALDPARAPRLPQDLLRVSQFAIGLPSPPPLAAAAGRRKTRVGTTRIVPINPDQAYSAAVPAPSGLQITGAEPPVPEPAPAPPPPAQSYFYPEPAVAPPPPPAPVYYAVPVPEVVVIERDRPRHREAPRGGGPRHDSSPGIRPAPAPAHPPAAPAPTPQKPAVDTVQKGQLVTAPQPASDSGDKGKIQTQSSDANQKTGVRK